MKYLAVRRIVTFDFLSVEGFFQERNEPRGTSRMEKYSHIVESRRRVMAVKMGRDVPLISGAVLHTTEAFAMAFDHVLQADCACCNRPPIYFVGVFNVH